jgi:hypothetical protein
MATPRMLSLKLSNMYLHLMIEKKGASMMRLLLPVKFAF